MKKEIFIEKFIDEDERPRGQREFYRGRGAGINRHDKGRGFHINGGRRDGYGPHLEEGCNVTKKYPSHNYYRKSYEIKEFESKTKMFTSKEELVKFVNKIGAKGQKADVFKIEDDLYKVVYTEQIEVKEEKEVL